MSMCDLGCTPWKILPQAGIYGKTGKKINSNDTQPNKGKNSAMNITF